MVAYNFKSRFVPLIESGQKCQTIRAVGQKRHARPEERIQLYTGLRQRGARKLIEPDPVCTSVDQIVIHYPDRSRRWPMLRYARTGDIFKDEAGLPIGEDAVIDDDFARADGFTDADDFTEFWDETHHLNDKPFIGLLIRWELR